jgi:dTDP-4-dehydrorhamnose 3,5-epimerase
MIELKALEVPGAYLLKAKIFRDDRGEFHKTFHRPTFDTLTLKSDFVEQFYTRSAKDVIRGMHYQRPPHDHIKLIYCTEGHAIDVLLDLRQGSPMFGKCLEVELQGGDGLSIYIPEGVAHGFRSLEDNTTIVYSVTTVHEPSSDEGVLWNSIPFDWGIKSPKISDRDRKLIPLAQLKSPFKL